MGAAATPRFYFLEARWKSTRCFGSRQLLGRRPLRAKQRKRTYVVGPCVGALVSAPPLWPRDVSRWTVASEVEGRDLLRRWMTTWSSRDFSRTSTWSGVASSVILTCLSFRSRQRLREEQAAAGRQHVRGLELPRLLAHLGAWVGNMRNYLSPRLDRPSGHLPCVRKGSISTVLHRQRQLPPLHLLCLPLQFLRVIPAPLDHLSRGIRSP